MNPVVIGLTGSIGMGKSTISRLLRLLNIPVQEADQVAHTLLETDSEIRLAMRTLFPQLPSSCPIDRQALGDIVFQNPEKLKALEDLLHPKVKKHLVDFIQEHRPHNVVVLDIPLLFEAQFDSICHYIFLAECDFETQKKRVLARPHMTEERFQQILSYQMLSQEKRKRSDYCIDTGFGKKDTFLQIIHCLKEVAKKEGRGCA